MDSETARAFIAVMLRGQDVYMLRFSDEKTYDYYLGQAQQILESSYRNYLPRRESGPVAVTAFITLTCETCRQPYRMSASQYDVYVRRGKLPRYCKRTCQPRTATRPTKVKR